MVKIRLFSNILELYAKYATNSWTKLTEKYPCLNSCNIKWCSLPWSGSWGRQEEKNSLRDDLENNCKQDYDFVVNWKQKNHNAHIYGAFCGINKSIIQVSLKIQNKALSKTFCFDTVNFVYYHSDEYRMLNNMLITLDTEKQISNLSKASKCLGINWSKHFSNRQVYSTLQ